MSEFVPLLVTHDWNEEWRRVQDTRQRVGGADFWNKRALTFSEKDAPSSYVSDFLHLAGVRPGESVFDMGCGAGDLCIPLAKAGHEVTAADFSSGMLGLMEEKIERGKLSNVEPLLMSWEDDWPSCGVSPGSFDVCLASRSLAVADLEQALLKLHETARRRVCVTLSTGASPRTDERVLKALGLSSIAGNDYLYAFAVLARHGIKAELTYINSERVDFFESYEQAYAYYERMVVDSALQASEEDLILALKRLREWLKEELVEIKRSLGERPGEKASAPLRLREPRVVSWAFLAWNK